MAEKTMINSNAFDDLKSIHAQWVSWSPYAFCDHTTGTIKYNQSWQWEGETLNGTSRAVSLAHQKGIKTMIKPHVWMSDHSYTGSISLPDSSWENWQRTYKKYILDFAALAQKNQVDLFCIGTEQWSSISHDSAYWNVLIDDVRKTYQGKIIYAANWDRYASCPFWNKLDYIGVDAYFPLSTQAKPSVKALSEKWLPWKEALTKLSRRTQKKIIFTECGYKSSEFCTKNPWEHIAHQPYCEKCQALALQAMFESIWAEKWFAGGFLWKWFEQEKSIRQTNKKSFRVQGKAGEKTIKAAFLNLK